MRSLARLLVLAAAPMSLCACQGFERGVRGEDPHLAASPFGLYLAGQAAESSGEGGEAADLMARAALAARSQEGAPFLQGQAFTAALLAGDVSRAAAIAPTPADGVEPRMAHLGDLVRGVESMVRHNPTRARAALKLAETDPATASPAALLMPFSAAEAGEVQASFVLPVIGADPIAQFFARLDQGKLYERAHRFAEAETAFKALIDKGDPGGIASLELGRMLERQGRRADAVAVYEAALARSKGDETLAQARVRAAAGRPAPPLPGLFADAAEALMAPASVLSSRKDDEGALYTVRLALRLDPDRDEAWLLLGDTLANLGEKAAARAAYERPKRGSPQYEAARAKLAWSYQGDGQKEQALEVARQTLEADPDNRDAAVDLADLLRSDERYADSAKVLDPIIIADGATPDWKLLYMRAVDAEESGDWTAAEADLRKALELRPDEPELLNFLGYSWIDRGERLPEALAMVEKAVSLDPQSGAMVDSLGWGYYRLGQYPKAVERLEAAVALEPGDPDVNDHLGDAYWRVGRRLEARFQWRRVLTLDPSAKLKTQVEGKLTRGLDGQGSAVVADGERPA
ncbi:MAG TPA: tetratricopeptide repeat protein [Caulobacteraceae bacterium]|jgi:tetratricopeptide (TPR) repeat protein|nr:tetratricopeptide repeat protein [Caulobacteraceae bacterium]